MCFAGLNNFSSCEMAACLLCTRTQEFESCSFHMLKIIKSAPNWMAWWNSALWKFLDFVQSNQNNTLDENQRCAIEKLHPVDPSLSLHTSRYQPPLPTSLCWITESAKGGGGVYTPHSHTQNAINVILECAAAVITVYLNLRCCHCFSQISNGSLIHLRFIFLLCAITTYIVSWWGKTHTYTAHTHTHVYVHTYIHQNSVNYISTSTRGSRPFFTQQSLPSSPQQHLHPLSLEIKSQIWCQFYCQFILPVGLWNIYTCREKGCFCLSIQSSSLQHPAGCGTTRWGGDWWV